VKVIEFMDTIYSYDEDYAEERLMYTLISLAMKGYDPFEVLQMDVDEMLFLMEIPHMKQHRKGTTTWGSHLATVNS